MSNFILPKHETIKIQNLLADYHQTLLFIAIESMLRIHSFFVHPWKCFQTAK